MRNYFTHIAPGKCFLISFFVWLAVMPAAHAQQVSAGATLSPVVQHGIASYYASSFNGQKTATGEIFSNKNYTAASNRLPLGTYVKVTNPRNNKWVIVKVNDRMSKYNKRAIDLTKAAARELHMISRGIARVEIEVIPMKCYEFFGISPSQLLIAIDKRLQPTEASSF